MLYYIKYSNGFIINNTHITIQSKAMHYKNPEELIKKLQEDPQPFREMRNAFRILGDKWSALILIHLINKPCRFTDIENTLSGLNPRTLASKLKTLESEGLITKQEYKEFPPRTEYSATEKARELKPAMHELKKWAKKYCANTDEMTKSH